MNCYFIYTLQIKPMFLYYNIMISNIFIREEVDGDYNTLQHKICLVGVIKHQKKEIVLLPPGGLWILTLDLSVVGPELFPEITLFPNVG